ncbi:MAG TPA: GNAT family N-acetyltransferase [Kofleriaceae bacterium]
MAELVVRAVRAQDFAALAAITNHYIATSSIHFGYAPVTDGELQAQWQAAGARYPWLAAALDGEVVGYAKAGVWRDRTAYQWTTEVGLYVADALRGRGLGRALYAALLDDVQRRGFRSVIAGITLPNPASVRLHEAFGFRHVGIFEDAGWKQGAWHAVGFWQKQLATDASPPAGAPPTS